MGEMPVSAIDTGLVVQVLDPIETTGLTPADVPALKERVRGIISSARDRIAADLAQAKKT